MAEHKVSVQIGAVTFQVQEGDITEADTAGLANAANNHLWMGSGVAGAIKCQGGEQIEREAVAQGPIPVGTVVATSAGKLPAQAILHGAVMGPELRTSAELISRTTTACLELAESIKLDSLALPAFGTGVGGFPLDDCAELMVTAAGEFARQKPRVLKRIIFVLFSEDAYAAFAVQLRVLKLRAGEQA